MATELDQKSQCDVKVLVASARFEVMPPGTFCPYNIAECARQLGNLLPRLDMLLQSDENLRDFPILALDRHPDVEEKTIVNRALCLTRLLVAAFGPLAPQLDIFSSVTQTMAVAQRYLDLAKCLEIVTELETNHE